MACFFARGDGAHPESKQEARHNRQFVPVRPPERRGLSGYPGRARQHTMDDSRQPARENRPAEGHGQPRKLRSGRNLPQRRYAGRPPKIRGTRKAPIGETGKYSATRMLPQGRKRSSRRPHNLKWRFGAFSNLGEWNSGGELSVSETDETAVASSGEFLRRPPVASPERKTVPVHESPSEISTDPLFARKLDRPVLKASKNWH